MLLIHENLLYSFIQSYAQATATQRASSKAPYLQLDNMGEKGIFSLLFILPKTEAADWFTQMVMYMCSDKISHLIKN